MTAKWKEVSAYTGQSVEEDAPTNFAGKGSGVAMPPDAMMRKKKKKKLLDARTKEYKAHQARLEASRQKRNENKKSKFIEKVKESIDEFEREFADDAVAAVLRGGRGEFSRLARNTVVWMVVLGIVSSVV